MAKVDLLLTSGLTASDGSIITSGATLKFDAEFLAGTTDIRIIPKMYRNRELFESGFTNILISENIIPNDFILTFTDEEYYSLTPYDLYQKVGEYLNELLEADYFNLKLIE
jgi:hypothetical protein